MYYLLTSTYNKNYGNYHLFIVHYAGGELCSFRSSFHHRSHLVFCALMIVVPVANATTYFQVCIILIVKYHISSSFVNLISFGIKKNFFIKILDLLKGWGHDFMHISYFNIHRKLSDYVITCRHIKIPDARDKFYLLRKC